MPTTSYYRFKNHICLYLLFYLQPRLVSGVVLEVVLENFLCHTHYSVTLNKEINFIVGRNGSGKSAILTGLVVALGGTASITGRGAALKGVFMFLKV